MWRIWGNPALRNASQAPGAERSDCRDVRSICILAHASRDGVPDDVYVTFVIGSKNEIQAVVSV